MEDLKEEFLTTANFDAMLGDVIGTVCALAKLEEKDFQTVLKNIRESELDHLYFNIFVSFFGGEEKLLEYLKLQKIAIQASENFIYRLDEALSDEVNNVKKTTHAIH